MEETQKEIYEHEKEEYERKMKERKEHPDVKVICATERRKCSPPIFAAAGIFPSYFRGDIKVWEVNVKMEKKTRRAPCSGAPRVVQIHDSLYSSPRRSR